MATDFDYTKYLQSIGQGAGMGATLGGPWGAAVGGGLALLSSIPTWMQGKSQDDQANKLLSTPRPVYTIPGSEEEALVSAKKQAEMTRLPGQNAIEGKLDQTTANTISELERLSPGSATSINAAGRAYGNEMDKENDLGINAAKMYLNNQNILRDELHTHAGFEDQAFQYNKADPYAEAISYGRALKGAGIQNKNSAVQNAFGTAANLARAFPWEQILKGEPTTPTVNDPYSKKVSWSDFSNSVGGMDNTTDLEHIFNSPMLG